MEAEFCFRIECWKVVGTASTKNPSGNRHLCKKDNHCDTNAYYILACSKQGVTFDCGFKLI
ncbi:hypothetical protein M7I_8121 [Glarea lozoyensis 74030]|uniref:Uncharacterized protein n=1 Tax=Glarea lozoyensis (strain ATCC 74030 / MF5533) TaxID=1104152 RepID=H0EZ59_GLAL7|nr:hypothetical protein M7I_8121 [Glarea lozoyensis 74030]